MKQIFTVPSLFTTSSPATGSQKQKERSVELRLYKNNHKSRVYKKFGGQF